ncbi:MarR family transcriptional regulator [Mesorhizobium sp. M7A.F.Ca.US.008.03.1.1]|uniref:MarR family winged helix-turn-helix transcriptional regulator n=1 Tax=Mesorhizobium sp. M7A.F.Ca.US.008.03.1.1 TaxID=2496742 RepID=UPI000FCA77FA|nr:MarR family transcriptional regulator [Mesorhizobium sp. M7A.F.Ca.US.008.03.1.1]RUW59729.1 MarR family transcriptional regulator [Mesorhizobium sp. M7A.F.Ca.US.008.03.1.1]
MTTKQTSDVIDVPADFAGIPKLDDQICFALYSASGLMTKLYRPLLEPLGLTYPQYLAMMALWEQAPRTVGGLGEALGLDSATLTPLLKRLEAGGFLTRRRDAADERRVLLELTAKGQALREPAKGVAVQILCQFPRLSAAELDGLHHILAKLIAGLRETDVEAPAD